MTTTATLATLTGDAPCAAIRSAGRGGDDRSEPVVEATFRLEPVDLLQAHEGVAELLGGEAVALHVRGQLVDPGGDRPPRLEAREQLLDLREVDAVVPLVGRGALGVGHRGTGPLRHRVGDG